MRNITEGIILAAKKRSKIIITLVNYHHPRPSGDSMLKYINPMQLRRSTRSFNTQIKTFPGAKVSDMEYYVKRTLARTPDHLILHVGTNDVRQDTTKDNKCHIHAWATDQEGTTYNESRYFRSNYKK